MKHQVFQYPHNSTHIIIHMCRNVIYNIPCYKFPEISSKLSCHEIHFYLLKSQMFDVVYAAHSAVILCRNISKLVKF